ncbi:sigma-70 RNA polymerase sigma factor region 4 domain-containing protein [Vallitalea maricola]|uniref:Uncharacterized protein n=1 Tax=Vallitalea maricola TaxID=3074433 RepID=A0ACB5UMH7_9FIRM|nr:hypothetical protein AN2V17_34030 [Vallitalea sp. AN17-2]
MKIVMTENMKKIVNNLKSYHLIEQTIKIDEKYLQESPLNGINYDTIKTGSTNNIKSPVETIALRRIQKENRIKEYKNIIMELNDAMSILDEVEEKIIRLRDIEHHTWMQVEYHVNLSESQCKRIRKRGLSKMEEIIYHEQSTDENEAYLNIGL